jgi:hypothetical protein
MRLIRHTHSCVRVEHDGIHQAQLDARRLSSVNGRLSETCRAYRYLAPGGSYDKLPG